jgi:hypothetical protein
LEVGLIKTPLSKHLHQTLIHQNTTKMNATSSTTGNLATATYLSVSPTTTATASVASSFSWNSIKEVFLIVVLYIWYAFLFTACGAIVVGGIWAVLASFGYLCKWVGEYWEPSEQTAAGAANQNNEPQMGEAESRMGTETV